MGMGINAEMWICTEMVRRSTSTRVDIKKTTLSHGWESKDHFKYILRLPHSWQESLLLYIICGFIYLDVHISKYPSIKIIVCVFVTSPEPPKEPEKEEEWSDVPSDVVHLTDSSFDEFMEKNPSVLVMFYAPCKFSCWFKSLSHFPPDRLIKY